MNFLGLQSHEVIMLAIGIVLLVGGIWRWMSGKSKAAELMAILPFALGLLGYPAHQSYQRHLHDASPPRRPVHGASLSTPVEPVWLRDGAVRIEERQV